MNRTLAFLPAACFALVSCDQVGKLVEQASNALSKEIKAKVAQHAPPPVPDPQTSPTEQEVPGVVFRKDLPFPDAVVLKSTVKREISGRFFHSSELGKNVENVKGTELTVSEIERTGDMLRYTLRESSFTLPVIEKAADGKEQQPQKVKNPLQQATPSTEPVNFRRTGSVWKVDAANKGFREMVLSQQLSPVFDELLVDHALAPRPLWFSKTPIKIGDELKIAGTALPMLVAGDAKGSLNLKFEAIENVHGQPCGVFSVKGTYIRLKTPNFQGQLMDEEVTIEDGRLWLSTQHPVILKEELNTIQTFKPAGDGGLVGRGQGTIRISAEREWKVKAAAAPSPQGAAPVEP